MTLVEEKELRDWLGVSVKRLRKMCVDHQIHPVNDQGGIFYDLDLLLERAVSTHTLSDAERKLHELKVEAQAQVLLARKDGKLPFNGPCEVCGDPNGHGHHEDYSTLWI
jgi:hypothetical protein